MTQIIALSKNKYAFTAMGAISLDYSSHNDKLVTSMHKNIFRLFATETKVEFQALMNNPKRVWYLLIGRKSIQLSSIIKSDSLTSWVQHVFIKRIKCLAKIHVNFETPQTLRPKCIQPNTDTKHCDRMPIGGLKKNL